MKKNRSLAIILIGVTVLAVVYLAWSMVFGPPDLFQTSKPPAKAQPGPAVFEYAMACEGTGEYYWFEVQDPKNMGLPSYFPWGKTEKYPPERGVAFVQMLNAHSSEGWELVAPVVTRTNLADSRCFVFKRSRNK